MKLCPKSYLAFLLCAGLTAYTPLVSANKENDGSWLFDLSLEELLKVSVVSGNEEMIKNSPGIVSTYYPEQLQNFGLYTMDEILGFVTSMEVNQSLQGTTTLQTRGLSDANNQKNLFLINGVPYWMPSHGDIPLNGIPVGAIKRIEVIRGPASVIYGTNSSAGVINIITKDLEDNLAQVYVGENGVSDTQLFISKELKRGSATFSMQARTDDGYEAVALNTFDAFDPGCSCFPNKDTANIENAVEYFSFLSTVKYNDLNVIVQAYEEERNAYTNGSVLSPSVHNKKGYLASLSYDQHIDNVKLKYFTDWNRFYWEKDVTDILLPYGIPGDGALDFDNNGKNNTRLRAGFDLTYTYSNQLSFLGGAVYEERRTENNKFRDDVGGSNLLLLSQPPFNIPFEYQSDGSILLIEEDELDEKSVYLQADYTDQDWRIISGLRYINNESAGNHISPRLSLIYSLSDYKSLKFLYGEGFNSPDFRQLSARSQLGLAQDIDISAEIIQTYEMSYNHTLQDSHQVFTVFYTEAKDLIQLSSTGVSNSINDINRSGLEYEFNYKMKNTIMMGSLAYLDQGNKVDIEDQTAQYASQWLGRFGFEHKIKKQSFGASLKASSSRANVDKQYWANLNYRYSFSSASLFISVNNVFSEDIYHPSVRVQGEDIIQAADEQSIIIGVNYKF